MSLHNFEIGFDDLERLIFVYGNSYWLRRSVLRTATIQTCFQDVKESTYYLYDITLKKYFVQINFVPRASILSQFSNSVT